MFNRRLAIAVATVALLIIAVAVQVDALRAGRRRPPQPAPATRSRRPTTRPLTEWPYLGCVGCFYDEATGEKKATFVGFSYDDDHLIGACREGDHLPKPFNRWHLLMIDDPPDPADQDRGNVVLREENTGRKVKLYIVGLPLTTTRPAKRATAHP